MNYVNISMSIIGRKLFIYTKAKGTDLHVLYMSDGTFLTKNVKSWKYNRPPDNEKITEIVKVISETNCNSIEGIIYVAHIDGEYVCYDGNHRLEALKLLKTKKLVLVDIMEASAHTEIKTRFVELNKSNPVSELYTIDEGDMQDKMREIIEKVVDNLCKTFPQYKSASKTPQRPNFNKDSVTELLFQYLRDKDVTKLTVSDLWNKILDVNMAYAKGKHITHSKYSKTMLNKCRKFGCYLFLKGFTEDL